MAHNQHGSLYLNHMILLGLQSSIRLQTLSRWTTQIIPTRRTSPKNLDLEGNTHKDEGLESYKGPKFEQRDVYELA